jgi:hypothetical protein
MAKKKLILRFLLSLWERMPEGQERDKTKIFPSSGPPRRTTFSLREKGIMRILFYAVESIQKKL